MRYSLWNLLGPITATYQFDDGTEIRFSAKECVAYIDGQRRREIELYTAGKDGCEYFLPNGLSREEQIELIQKMDEYCRNKRYKIAVRGYIDNIRNRVPFEET